ncbi:TPA: DNA (cytosine-5-)-methyltransferase, partial [Klebsiella pneumoniae]|nr:DNA (cytosine-5-)-methyltransferase [Klebsiella pneumoniae]
MKELQPVINELIQQSLGADQLKQKEELCLLKKVLEIYDQKVVAEVLRAVSGSDWTR